MRRLLLACVLALLGAACAPQPTAVAPADAALAACREAAQARIPTAAHVRQLPDHAVTNQLGDGHYQIAAWLMADDANGHQERRHFGCEMRLVGDRWQAVSVDWF